MNVIYLSSCCSDTKFNELREKGITRKLPQAQKYHNLLIEGIAQNIDGTLSAVSAFPVNHQWTKQNSFSREEETFGNIHYIYGAFLNRPILRQLTRIIGTKREIKKIYKNGGADVIICDILNQSLANAARKCGKKYKIPVIGIVTDVPGHTSGARKKSYSFIRRCIISFAEQNAQRNLAKYDAYLLLTEAMNAVVNKNERPYIVLEGHCDIKMQHTENSLEIKSKPKIAMYAGGIHKEFGIERLVNAFTKGDFTDWELHIYGDGNYQDDLTELAARVPNVKYFGVQPNSVIVDNQLKATLLLNPRLTDAEYVKYSFPSKTMECMASGTPLCTTRLPGMPTEYYPYVYFFDDETEEGMLNTLKEVLGKDAEEYHEFGKKAKEFVLTEKNNSMQAKKLIDFICTIRR
ncbi:MAG: glycosyltransferase [Oscillospiraceae bacterium]|nr:glycosyltransferase [Oscillospiraceae bacterium]